MKYLEIDYRLEPVKVLGYKNQAIGFAFLRNSLGDLSDTMHMAMGEEDKTLAPHVLKFSEYLGEEYGGGGAYYAMAFGIGMSALRETNPIGTIPAASPDDWKTMSERDERLRMRSGLTTLESVTELGLLGMRGVNPGYVEGYRQTMSTAALLPYSGLTGLATMHVHDLLHFASQRSPDATAA